MDSPRKDTNSSTVSIASQNPTPSMEKIQRVSQSATIPTSGETASLSAKIGEIQDPSLDQLHRKINDVMLPFLNRIFELKQDVQNAKLPSSRLVKNEIDVEEIRVQLASLSKDLEILISWCHGSLKQIEKVLEQTNPSPITVKSLLPKSPSLKKPFWKKIFRL